MIKLTNLKNSIVEVRIKLGGGNYKDTCSIYIEAGMSTEIENSQTTKELRDQVQRGDIAAVYDTGEPLPVEVIELVMEEVPEEVKEPVTTEEVKEPETPVTPEPETPVNEPPVEAPAEDAATGDKVEGNESTVTTNFICEVCGAEFASKAALTRHMNSAHK